MRVALEDIRAGDVKRCVALLQIGFVDASLVAVAERLRLRVIATTDRRHLGPIRPKHVPAFELAP